MCSLCSDNETRAKLEVEERLVSVTSSYETQLAVFQAECSVLRTQMAELTRGRRPSAASKIVSFLEERTTGSRHALAIPEDDTVTLSSRRPSGQISGQQSHEGSGAGSSVGLGIRPVVEATNLVSPPRVHVPTASPTPKEPAAAPFKIVVPEPAKMGPLHAFMVTTLTAPTACHYCHSLLRGVVRQGVVCAHCQYLCHSACAHALADGHQMCPSSAQMPSAAFDPINVNLFVFIFSLCWHLLTSFDSLFRPRECNA